MINKINDLAPLGHSDHVCLKSIGDFDVNKTDQLNRLNYSKGDYNNFRSFLNVDWSITLNLQPNNCETICGKYSEMKLSKGKICYFQTK